MKATINGVTFDGTVDEMVALVIGVGEKKPLHVETSRRVSVADEIELFPTSEKKGVQMAESYKQKRAWHKTVYLHVWGDKNTTRSCYPSIAAMLRSYKVDEMPLYSGHFTAEQYTRQAARMLIDSGVPVREISRADNLGKMQTFTFCKSGEEVRL